MDNLLQGIIAAYAHTTDAAAIALRAASPGGMWLNSAPETITGAYIVIVPLGSPIEFTMGGTSTSECSIQFTISSPNNMGESSTAKAALISLYQDKELTMTARKVIYARQTDDGNPMRDPDSGGYSINLGFRYILGNK